MNYHIKQLPLHCRVCGQRLMTRKHKKEIHECKAFAADLQIAFAINTNTDNAQVYPDHQCQGRRYGKHIPMKGVRYIQHVYAFMQHHQYTKSYHRCVSISVSMQKVQLGSIQLAEVVNLASHRTC